MADKLDVTIASITDSSALAKPSKVVLVVCGCFNPITVMHLRMLERARDAMHALGQYEVIRGVISPANDAYTKEGLLPADQRVYMAKLASASLNWVDVDDYESKVWNILELLFTLFFVVWFICQQVERVRTLSVLQHIKETYSSHGDISVMLVCGADLLHSITLPGVWIEDLVVRMLDEYGLVVLPRMGFRRKQIIESSALLSTHKSNIICITEPLYNNISSTVVRNELSVGNSVRFLTPDSVIQYIYDHKLYGSAGRIH